MKAVSESSPQERACFASWPAVQTFPPSSPWPSEVNALRRELADLAFDYERQGRPDAADVAAWVGQRLADLEARVHEPIR